MLTAGPLQLPDLTESTLPLHPQVRLLQFETWGCSEVSGEVVRVHEGEHGCLILAYKCLIRAKRKLTKPVVDRERCTSLIPSLFSAN